MEKRKRGGGRVSAAGDVLIREGKEDQRMERVGNVEVGACSITRFGASAHV